MPKSYEDEIRDLLKGMDRFPGEGGRPRRRRWSLPSLPSLGRLPRLDPQRIMGGALILMLFAWILRGPWASNDFPLLVQVAGYISLASIVLFVVALVMLVRAGSFGGSMYREQRWRGQVVNLPRRGGLFSSLGRWFRGLRPRFWRGSGSGGRGRTGARGRDSFQW